MHWGQGLFKLVVQYMRATVRIFFLNPLWRELFLEACYGCSFLPIIMGKNDPNMNTKKSFLCDWIGTYLFIRIWAQLGYFFNKEYDCIRYNWLLILDLIEAYIFYEDQRAKANNYDLWTYPSYGLFSDLQKKRSRKGFAEGIEGESRLQGCFWP